MPLVNMTEMLAAAKADGYAVAAFNFVDFGSFASVVAAADELRAPIIAQISVKTIKVWGYSACASWARELGDRAKVPVALHVDHCKDLEVIEQCIAHGWTSVMYDGSALPFDQNLANTREVVAMAVPKGVSVEAELGTIGGVEDDLSVDDEDAHLADPAKAIEFCAGLDLAVFAPAIGTAHGVYKGEPKIAFERLEEISTATGLPIALHGGTGLTDGVFRRCIALGCAKVNISTQLKYAFIDGFCDYQKEHPDNHEPVKVIAAQLERMRAEVREKIELFGGDGKA